MPPAPLQAFLDEKTRAKISLAHSEEELRAALLPHIRPAALYQSLGGCALSSPLRIKYHMDSSGQARAHEGRGP